MTTYRKIHGRAIKSVSSNLSAPSAEGQIWFNTTDNKFRSVVNLEAWISSGVLPGARQNVEGCGTQTAGLVSSGASGPGTPTFLNTSCEYNGTGWSGTTTKNSPGVIAESVFGVQTAAVAAGGYRNDNNRIDTVEEYNGSSWTSGNTLPQAQTSGMGCGAENDGLVAGGESSTAVLTNTQEYDGTNWTAGGAIPAATYNAGAGGTSQSNSWFAGGGDGFKNATLIYDGSSWTASGNINTARDQHGGAGISTAALIFGGRTPPSTTSSATEKFDGSSWTTSPATLGTAAKQSAAFGTKTAAVYAGNDPAANITQEYNSSANLITAGAWASGGAMSTARQDGAGFGTQTSAAVVGGETPSITNNTEHYDGSSFSSGGNYPQSYTTIGTFGTQTAGVGYGGNESPGAANNTTAEYNGSSWTAVNNYPISIRASRGCGTLTAGLAVAGDTFPPTSGRNSDTSKTYDGTNWTNAPSLGTGGYAGMVAGTQTAAVIVGGSNRVALTEEYDGSSWTAGGASIINMSFGGSSNAGTQDNMTTFVTNSSPYAFVQRYDGTAMSTDPQISTARYAGTGAGTAPASLAMGGRAPPFSTAVEEFTAETTALNVKDLTQS